MRRIEQRIKVDDKMKSLWNKIKSEKKKKNVDKVNFLENELVKIKYVDNPNKLQSELKELKKVKVVDKSLHEIKNEILKDYAGEIEMIGKISVGDQICETHIRFRNLTVYKAYTNSIDEGYDAEDAIFIGYVYIINTPQFSLINRSQYWNVCVLNVKSLNIEVIIVLYQQKVIVL